MRQRTNLEGHTTFLGSTELTDLVNEALTENWDLMVAASPPDYFSSETTITTVAGTKAYSLPATFYKLRAVYLDEGSSEYRPLVQANDQEEQYYRPPSGVHSVIVRFIQCCPLLTTGAATFDGVNGWEELAVLTAAINALGKEGTDASALRGERARLEKRIMDMADRNPGEPQRVIRRARNGRSIFRSYASSVDAYRLTAGNIDLLRVAGEHIL